MMKLAPIVDRGSALRWGLFSGRRWVGLLSVGVVVGWQVFGGARAWGIVDVQVEESAEVLYRNAVFGDPAAQFSLAECYEEGRKVTPSAARAREWYRKAAVAGYSRAEARLGERLYDGKGVAKDEKEAVRWLHMAARNGMIDAQMMMVDAYLTGRGVEKNLATALVWDLIARRTMELHFGVAAGLPAKGDGDGKGKGKEAALADGGRPDAKQEGLRYIENRNGLVTAVYGDGSWETVYPFGGITQGATAEGQRTLRDGEGNFETTEPDGSRVSEETRTDPQGAKVRIRNTFDSAGKLMVRRVTAEDSVYEERGDGTRSLETRLKRDDGVEVILTEPVVLIGSPGPSQLRRADDGAVPKEGEIWTVRRTLHPAAGSTVEVIEKYSHDGLRSQQILRQVMAAATPAPTPAVAGPTERFQTSLLSTPPPTRGVPGLAELPGVRALPTLPELAGPPSTPKRAPSYDDPLAFARPANIEPLQRMLEKIEARAQHFAGTTEADYQHAQANAASYVIPLSMVPQNVAPIPAAVREQIVSGGTMHLTEFPLVPLPDDHSREVPFGAHGAELIQTGGWQHAQTEHFFVHFRGNAEAGLAVQYVEGAYTVIMQLMNLDPKRGPARSHIFVLSAEEWKAYKTAHGLAPQLGGFAYKTELILGASADGFARVESIHVLCHEVTHAILARFYRDQKLPLWLNEGLADYIGLRTIQAKGVLEVGKYQAVRDKIMAALAGKPDAQMEVGKVFTRVRYGNRTTPDRMGAFYANSQKCVRTLIEKLPVDRFALFFNALAAGNEPNVAFMLAYGSLCGSAEDFGRLVNGGSVGGGAEGTP